MGISVNDNNMNMEDHIVNLPKKGLKTRPYSELTQKGLKDKTI